MAEEGGIPITACAVDAEWDQSEVRGRGIEGFPCGVGRVKTFRMFLKTRRRWAFFSKGVKS